MFFFQDSVRADFTIYNNGSIDEEFVYSFESTSEDIWYPYTQRSIQINAGESKVVTLAGHFNSNDEGGLDFNNVHMALQSQNNHNISKTYNFTVYAIPSNFGDINFDSNIDILDVLMMVGFILGNIELTQSQITSADMDQSGDISINDIILQLDSILSF